MRFPLMRVIIQIDPLSWHSLPPNEANVIIIQLIGFSVDSQFVTLLSMYYNIKIMLTGPMGILLTLHVHEMVINFYALS